MALVILHELLMYIEMMFTFLIFYCSRKDFGLVIGMEKDDSYKVHI